ncbi:hypothetical protein GX48_04467 [Paracoccidioides brasiliensis]|nr:hypothetical protein GX48_04467 [Paracoccidioides brasiliensis]
MNLGPVPDPGRAKWRCRKEGDMYLRNPNQKVCDEGREKELMKDAPRSLSFNILSFPSSKLEAAGLGEGKGVGRSGVGSSRTRVRGLGNQEMGFGEANSV